MKKIIWCLGLSLCFITWAGCDAPAAEPEPFRWGMTLEEMNQAWVKSGQTDTLLREESTRLNVILPYNPLKSIRVQRGRLSSVFQARKTEGALSIGKLFGYLYDGKLFCRAQLFKDNPVLSSQEVLAQLKKQYPEGKIVRNFIGSGPASHFEYLSNEIYVFSNEEGAYYCEPLVLSKAVEDSQKGIDARASKDLKELRDSPITP